MARTVRTTIADPREVAPLGYAAGGLTDGYALVLDSTRPNGMKWAAVATGGGGGGAPTNASYVTLGTDATLTAERVLTAGTALSLTDAGAGSTVTVAVSDAELLALAGTTSAADALPYFTGAGTATTTTMTTQARALLDDTTAAAQRATVGASAVTVNGGSLADVDLDDATPAAPVYARNVAWQQSGGNVSAYVAIGPRRPSYTDLGMSDEFLDATGQSGSTNGLAAQWTAVNASSGTVDLIARPATAIYDFATRPGTMLVQVKESTISDFLQADILADGEELIVAITVPGVGGSAVSNGLTISVGFNSDATSLQTGTYDRFSLDGTEQGASGSWRMLHWNGSQVLGQSADTSLVGRTIYFRVIRDGDIFHGLWSVVDPDDSRCAWTPLGSFDNSSRGHTKTWLAFNCAAITDAQKTGTYELESIAVVHYVRHKAYAGLDPW